MNVANVRLVLHRPQSAENVGAAARAMKNFGLGRLAVVAPRAWEGAPREGLAATAAEDVLARARRTARRAGDVLDAASFHDDLRSALGPATWVCGTTSREVERRPRLAPRDLAAEVARRSTAGEVAVVFGEERRGLSDAELSLCQAVCTIPTAPAYDSMNLAHAVAVISYELAVVPGAHAPGADDRGAEAPARHETLEALWDRTRALLAAVGYLNPQRPDLVLGELRRVLARAEPTQREAELLAAAVKALERVVRGPGA
ncbi:MAG TPA: TrmH family RNA methyltransferase [Anaeromyxobacter sp.]|nr:TrmH family RNA methyltransferase [Anaeromyxobacter sp.]